MEACLPASVADDALVSVLSELAWTPLDVTADLPIRLRLLRIGDDAHILVLTVSHLNLDGGSTMPFARTCSPRSLPGPRARCRSCRFRPSATPTTRALETGDARNSWTSHTRVHAATVVLDEPAGYRRRGCRGAAPAQRGRR